MPDKTPPQPASPPKGTSPSPSIQRGADQTWDEWHQHGNTDAATALKQKHTDNPVDPSSQK